MPFEIVRNDIVNMQVDVVVNTANPNPVIGSGVDRGIHKKAGHKLLAARKKIGSIAFGEAVITPGYGMDAKYVIHTVGPVWVDGNHQEEQVLASCYRNSLKLAKEQGCESIAFPLIATGNYGFPKALALQIAVREISAFLLENEMQVYLVVFGREAFVLSEKLFQSVSSYIDENYIHDKTLDEYGTEMVQSSGFSRRQIREYLKPCKAYLTASAPFVEQKERCKKPKKERASEEFGDETIDTVESILESDPEEVCLLSEAECISMDADGWEKMLKNLDAGFSETLLKLIDRTGKKDSEIYKKANVDRKLFSKIRNNVDYKPSKATALAFAFALELDVDETRDFIARAGFALSHSSKFDVIVEYFLVNRNYNVFELNEVLFAFDQPLIGA